MKNSSLTSKLLAAALTLGVLAYFGVQIYRYVDDPFSTTLVYSYRVEDTLDISGYMVRQEQVLTGESGAEKRGGAGQHRRRHCLGLCRSSVAGPAERDGNAE